MGWKDKAKAASFPETTEEIVLGGALLAEHDRIREEIRELKERPGASLAGSGVAALEEQIRAVEQEMKESVVVVRLRAVPRTKRPDDDRPSWRELTEAHPPRISDDGVMDARDRLAGGVNADSFPEVMVRHCVVELDGEPKPFPREEDWQQFNQLLSQGQFDRLVSLCWALNRGSVSVPFYSSDSERTPASGGR